MSPSSKTVLVKGIDLFKIHFYFEVSTLQAKFMPLLMTKTSPPRLFLNQFFLKGSAVSIERSVHCVNGKFTIRSIGIPVDFRYANV